MNLHNVISQKQKFEIAETYRKLIRAVAAGKIDFNDPFLEFKLDAYYLPAGDSWPEAWIRLVKKLFGDPHTMHKQGLMHKTVPFWNPTQHHISIESLGIVNPFDAPNIYVKLAPGEHVRIPVVYTLGGKRASAVKSVAPQLVQLPEATEEQHEYDVSPISYTEWNTFYEFRMSKCCSKPIVWNENLTQCQCLKCGERIHAT
jgi:hypothetical protein